MTLPQKSAILKHMREEFCKQMVTEYAPGYTFRVNPRLTSTNGRCMFRDRLIEMSKPLIEKGSDEAVLNNLMHEIAHARVGPRHGHNEVWRREALRLGCNGKRCNDYGVTEKKVARYKLTCSERHFETTYNRKPRRDFSKFSCLTCRKKGIKGSLILSEAG